MKTLPAFMFILAAFLLGRALRLFLAKAELRTFVSVPLDFLTGLTLLSTLLYFSAWAWQGLTDLSWYPYLFWPWIGLVFLALFLTYRRQSQRGPVARSELGPSWSGFDDRVLIMIEILSTLAIFSWASLLTFSAFYTIGDSVYAGVTVFSDLSPHTAFVASFGQGGNIPAQYPYFSGAGMRYHFFFYFMCGVLHRLGLPLDWALNLPSFLGIWTFLSLLGNIAVSLTRKKAALPLTLLLFFFRSSGSGFALLNSYLRDGLSLTEALVRLRSAPSFAGPLLHDDWGLYNLNVFANQRHLLWGMSLVLFIFMLFYPALSERDKPSISDFFHKDLWPIRRIGPLLFALLLALPLPYWHGSCAIVLLLVLGFWALFAREKMSYLILGLSTVGSAFVLQKIFQGQAGLGQSIFHWAYILDDKSLGGVLKFLAILAGPALIFILIFPWLHKDRTLRPVYLSFALPVLFGLTVSLTPDVTVNHKYFMISLFLYLPLVVWVLLKLWDFLWRPDTGEAFWPRRALAVLLACLVIPILTFTGLTDTWAYQNQLAHNVIVDTDDDFSRWVQQNTPQDAVSLTPPWAMHSYFLTGRQSFYGHAYYAASAGYDTAGRYGEIKDFLAMRLDDRQLRAYVEEHNLSYLMIDDSFRQNPDYAIEEEGLSRIFPRVAFFPDQDNLAVYDLRTH
jgi:hypothetical protein